MRIFGIDPGSERTGYGCVETDGRRHQLVACGVISARAGDPFPQRLARIHRDLVARLAACRPECVAVESLFHAVNARSALKLGHARGVAIVAAVEAGCEVVEYTPAEINGKPTPVIMTITTTFNMDVGVLEGPLTVPQWPAAEGVARVGGSIAPPRRTKDARPDFPDEAQRRRTGGAVLLEVLIGANGKVRDVRVIRSSPLFDKAAMDAVRKWEYEPTRIDGTAVSVVTTVTVTFSIK